jgi:hypothetical protein
MPLINKQQMHVVHQAEEATPQPQPSEQAPGKILTQKPKHLSIAFYRATVSSMCLQIDLQTDCKVCRTEHLKKKKFG